MFQSTKRVNGEILLGKGGLFQGVHHLRRFCIGRAEVTGEGWSSAQKDVMAMLLGLWMWLVLRSCPMYVYYVILLINLTWPPIIRELL